MTVRAGAEEHAPVVVVLVESRESPLSQRLKLEIESLGLQVRWGGPEVSPPEPLEGQARAADAIAAIRLTHVDGGAVEMTIVDRVTGKTVHRALRVSTPSDPAAAELIATRTVELLRASLMELASPHPPRGEVPITPKVRALAPAPVEPTPPKRGELPAWSLAAGPAVIYSPPWKAGAQVLLGLSWMPARRMGIEASVLIPLLPERFAGREGSADLAVTLYRLGAVVRLGSPASPLSLRTTAGVGAGAQYLSGTASPPYSSARDTLWTWSPYAGVGLGWRMTSGFGLRLEGSAGSAFPHTFVRFAGRQVADWGRPWCLGWIGVELSWP